jgi:hypothetical protein
VGVIFNKINDGTYNKLNDEFDILLYNHNPQCLKFTMHQVQSPATLYGNEHLINSHFYISELVGFYLHFRPKVETLTYSTWVLLNSASTK